MDRDRDFSDFSDQVQLVTRPSLRYLLIFLGALSTTVGIVGIFLPLVPTTPLLLLAAACFARASTTFYNALLNHRILGPPIRQWRSSRSLPLRAKMWAILMIFITFGISITFVAGNLRRSVLALIGVALIAYLSKLPRRSS